MKVFLVIILILYANSIMFATDVKYDLKLAYDLDLNSSVTLLDIDCIDESNCILIHTSNENNGMVAEKTTDGGKVWKIIYVDTSTKNPTYYPKNLGKRCKYFSDGTVILLGDRGKLLRSEDYGETFQELEIEHYYYWGFEMFNEKEAVTISVKMDGATGSEFGLYKSTDGCKTWQNFIIPDSIFNTTDFYQIFLQKNKELILGYSLKYPEPSDPNNNYFYKTDFEGSYWEQLTTPKYIDKLYFLDANEVIGVGKKRRTNNKEYDTAYTRKSYDGGKTWDIKFISPGPFNGFNYLRYYNDTLLTIYGWGFGFFKTTDKGESWFMPVFNLETNITQLILGTTNVKLFENDNFYLMTTFPGQVIKGTKVITSASEPSVKPSRIFPNPVSNDGGFTTEYEIERSGDIRIYVSDASGKIINELYSDYAEAGFYSTLLKLPVSIISGSYWLNTEINGFRHVQMLNVIK